ncbi:hypothetical protein ZWY2020_054246 [Hordeum vulgare]|nr:hypothetical protein ZWY2020_054246 [Hordeum vulgare]
MDVFHVTDAAGCKVADADKLLVRLESSPPWRADDCRQGGAHLELIGVDARLLSEVFVFAARPQLTVDATGRMRRVASVFVRRRPRRTIHDAAEQRRARAKTRPNRPA